MENKLDFNGVSQAAMQLGKVNEWNDAVAKIYLLAEELRTVAWSNEVPGWDYSKADNLVKHVSQLPHIVISAL